MTHNAKRRWVQTLAMTAGGFLLGSVVGGTLGIFASTFVQGLKIALTIATLGAAIVGLPSALLLFSPKRDIADTL